MHGYGGRNTLVHGLEGWKTHQKHPPAHPRGGVFFWYELIQTENADRAETYLGAIHESTEQKHGARRRSLTAQDVMMPFC